MEKVFLDSDVILDVLIGREPFVYDSSRVLSLGSEGKLRVYSSSVVFSNIYFILRKFTTHKEVIRDLKFLAGFFNFIPHYKEDIIEALYSKFRDFEDALQYFGCLQQSNVEAIITRNTKDFKLSKLPVYTPSQFLLTLNF